MKQNHTAKLAQTAGSLSVLALLPAGAQAGVIYHAGSLGPYVPPASAVDWDVDGNGSAEFRLQGYSAYFGKFLQMNSGVPAPTYGAYPIPLNGRGLVGTVGGIPGVYGNQFHKLAAGFAVGPTLAANYAWGSSADIHRELLTQATTGQVHFGSALRSGGGFSSGPGQYFGFRFTDGVDVFNGWAEINLGMTTGNAFITIERWAYESCANTGITVGATSGGASCGGGGSVPEPSTLSLALLGMGAGGVRTWRKRKQAQQALAA